MPRRQIYILTRHYPPDAGALSYRMSHLAGVLAEDHDVTVIAAQPNRYGTEPKEPRRRTVAGVTVRRVSNGRLLRSRGKLGRLASEGIGAVAMTVAALRHRRRADAVVVSVPPLTYALPGLAMKRWGGRTVVLDVRDLWLDWAEEAGVVRSAAALRAGRAFERAVVRAADHITVATAGFGDAIRERFGVDDDAVTVVYNGLDDALIPQTTARPRPEPGEPLGLLYAGNLGPSQNLLGIADGLTAAVDKWRNLTVTIVGNGEQHAALSALGHERIRVLPHVDRHTLGAMYEAADAFLLHLAALDVYRHTVPSKTFEYLAYATPLLCGVAGEARRIALRHTDCFVFASDDPASLAAAVDRLCAGAAPDNAGTPRGDPAELLRSSRTAVWRGVFDGLP